MNENVASGVQADGDNVYRRVIPQLTPAHIHLGETQSAENCSDGRSHVLGALLKLFRMGKQVIPA